MHRRTKGTEDKKEELMNEFRNAYDSAGTGKIGIDDLKTFIRSFDEKITSSEIDDMITEAGFAGATTIDYSRFIDKMLDT